MRMKIIVILMVLFVSSLAKNDELSPRESKMMETYLYMKDKYGDDHPTVLRLATQLGLLEQKTAESSRRNEENIRTIVNEGLRLSLSSPEEEDSDVDLESISMTGTDEEEKEEEKDVEITQEVHTKNKKANSILDGFLASRVTKVADAKRNGDATKLKLYTRELKDATTAIETLAEEEETGDVSVDSTNDNVSESQSESQNDDGPNETISAVLPFALTSGTLLVLIFVLILNGTCSCQSNDKKCDTKQEDSP